MLRKRASGILLHISSLPSVHGIGDLGPAAYQFADFLSAANQTYWQILPLNPIDGGLGNSPYSSASAFAGNTLLISLEQLVREGLLTWDEIRNVPNFPTDQTDFEAVRAFKKPLLFRAFQRFQTEAPATERYAYDVFCRDHQHWLDDFTLFLALHEHFPGVDWNQWPVAIRDRHETAMHEYRDRLNEKIQLERFLQYVFFKQWYALKYYCADRGIHFIGDLPIYVHFQSADVWANPSVFKLDDDKRPSVVAGVPPDYFSATGQLWGNPVYDWDYLKRHGYRWWLRRMKHNVQLFNLVRLDHFLGFIAYWEVAASEKTAINGQWVSAPADDFFAALFRQHPQLPIIAEDLGIVTPAVTHFMEKNHFPGMKVLLFAFGGDVAGNPYAPHNHVENCAVYTGTHDNNTIRGWFTDEADHAVRQQLETYLGQSVTEHTIAQQFIRAAMQSVARLVVIPVQDALNMGSDARMNTPGTVARNWAWRLRGDLLTSATAHQLREMTNMYGRG